MRLPYTYFTNFWASSSYYGYSNEEGFRIYRNTKAWRTGSYDPDNDINDSVMVSKFSVFFAIVFSIPFALLLLFFTEDPFAGKIVWIAVVGFSMHQIGLWVDIYLRSMKNSKLREYHACEHKTIILLEHGLPATIENLKKMPKTNIACGTQGVLFKFFILPYLVFLFICISFSFTGPAQFLFSITFIGTYIAAGCVLYLILPFFIQFFLSTKEPRESIYWEGVAIADFIYRS